MFTALKIELKRALKNKFFLISIIIGAIIALYHVIENVIPLVKYLEWDKGQYPHSLFNKWMGGENYSIQPSLYYIIAPILATIPYGDSLYIDKKTGFIKNIFSRTHKNYYYISKYISTFISGGLAVILPLIINFILTAMFIPALKPEPAAGTFPIFETSMWGELYYTHPYLYILLFLIMNYVFFGLIATVALIFSFYLENRFAVLLTPFLYYGVFTYVLILMNNKIFSPHIFLRPSQPSSGINLQVILVEIFILAAITISVYAYKGAKNEVY